MSEPEELAQVDEVARTQRALADALLSRDARGAMEATANDDTASRRLRGEIGAASADGVRITELLVAKLRFERLLQGSREAGAWFQRDPAAFAASFREYHTTVAPRADGPVQEAAAFARWRDERGD